MIFERRVSLMKRILFISPTTSMDNGAEKSIYYLMKYLIQLGHTVINVTHAIGGNHKISMSNFIK